MLIWNRVRQSSGRREADGSRRKNPPPAVVWMLRNRAQKARHCAMVKGQYPTPWSRPWRRANP